MINARFWATFTNVALRRDVGILVVLRPGERVPGFAQTHPLERLSRSDCNLPSAEVRPSRTLDWGLASTSCGEQASR